MVKKMLWIFAFNSVLILASHQNGGPLERLGWRVVVWWEESVEVGAQTCFSLLTPSQRAGPEGAPQDNTGLANPG